MKEGLRIREPMPVASFAVLNFCWLERNLEGRIEAYRGNLGAREQY